MASDVRITTGQFDFSGGVDSSKVPLIQSALYSPNGLMRSQLSWLDNGTVRGGGILQRTGYNPLCKIHDGSQVYQRGWLYDASTYGQNPYLMLSIGGRMFQVRVDADNSVHDVTGPFQDPDGTTAPKAWYCQQGRFMVKQAGDGKTLPLFWDGLKLFRSIGINNPAVQPGTPGQNQLPAATAMYGWNDRIFYSQNRLTSGGDIEFGNSGTPAYNFEDAVLNVTENPLAIGGDGFATQTGNVRALNAPTALDTTLGQGPLFVFTTNQIYNLNVPITRAAWIAAGANNMPYFPVVMKKYGTVSDTSVVDVNGDLFYQTLVPDVRSFFMALRYFQTWGNGSISNNINRILQFNNRALMHMSSGVAFGNRMYQLMLPVQTAVGVAFQSLVVMDLDPLSTLQNQNPPVWEGNQEGLNILQVFSGDFGGLERMFAVVQSAVDGGIWVWEVTSSDRFDQQETPSERRVEWFFETPAFDWSEYPRDAGGGPFELKELDGLTLWLDKVFGEVIIKVQFRPDEDPCWYDWSTERICASRNQCENLINPVCPAYPSTPNREQYRMPITFEKPINPTCSVGNDRPVTWGGKFQLKFTILGWCRVRGFHVHALHKQTAPFYNQRCKTFNSWQTQTNPFPPLPAPTQFENAV